MKARQYGLLGSGVLALAIAIGWYAFSSPFGASKAPVKLTAQSTGKLQCDLPAPDAASPHPGMVWVPAGKFDMGDSVYPEEKPVRNVAVKGFWMILGSGGNTFQAPMPGDCLTWLAMLGNSPPMCLWQNVVQPTIACDTVQALGSHKKKIWR